MPDAKKLPALTVAINTADIGVFTQAMLYTPEQPEPIAVPMVQDGDILTLTVPAGTFAGYAAIELK